VVTFEEASDRPRHGRYTGLHSAPPQHRSTAIYIAITAVILLAYPFITDLGRMLAFLTVSFATVPAVLIGMRRTERADRTPWRFMLAALVTLNLDNLAWYYYVYFQGLPTADGTISDLLATVGHVLMLLGAVSVVARRGRNDIGGLIDTSIVSMAAGGLLWDFVLLPHMESTGASTLAQTSMCIDIFLLTGVLGALVRLLSTAKEFLPALWLLVSALLSALVGNVLVALTIDPVTGARPYWTDMLFIVSWASLGLCGLDRSAVKLLRPGPAPKDDLNAKRLAFLGLALAAIPIVGGGRQILGLDVDGILLAIGAAAVTPLVMVRIGRLSAERARAESALLHEATHDPLTGLPNRREFTTRLAATVAEGRRLVVLFCDLDGFKGINDRLGHAAGDRLLIEVAGRLRRCVRDGDVVSRFGGDEFLIMCPDAESNDASELCIRIDFAMRDPVLLDGESVHIGASIGAVIGDGTVDSEQLIHRADAAMYEAKQSRRNVPGVRTVVA
jgi:diguanylate cyclase (GGDEF)-like protein